MVFNSLDDLVNYVESKHSEVMQAVGNEMVQIAKEEIMNQLYLCYVPQDYTRTRAMMDSPKINYFDNHNVIMEFINVGDWKSHGYGMSTYKGNGSPFFALEGLEAGTTWGRGNTNIVEGSFNRIVSEIPKVYKDELKSMGIPIV